MELRVEELRSFHDHPFQVKEDEAMDALCESIALYGVLSPCWPVRWSMDTRSSPATDGAQRPSGWAWTSSPCWFGT